MRNKFDLEVQILYPGSRFTYKNCSRSSFRYYCAWITQLRWWNDCDVSVNWDYGHFLPRFPDFDSVTVKPHTHTLYLPSQTELHVKPPPPMCVTPCLFAYVNILTHMCFSDVNVSVYQCLFSFFSHPPLHLIIFVWHVKTKRLFTGTICHDTDFTCTHTNTVLVKKNSQLNITQVKKMNETHIYLLSSIYLIEIWDLSPSTTHITENIILIE